MRYFILYITFCFCTINKSFGQGNIHLVGKPYIYGDSVRIDKCHFSVVYQHTFADTMNNIKLWSNIHMQIGERYIKQTNWHTHLANYHRTAIETNGDHTYDVASIDMHGNVNPTYFSDILSDNVTNTTLVTCCDYLLSASSSPWQYKESTPLQKWELQNDKPKEIAGYKCFRATTQFRGRKWEAWYTPDIPYNRGPWKLQGLPGLILYAYDMNDNYSFKCIEIHTEVSDIYQYHPASPKIVTRQNYLRYEKNYHIDPTLVIGKDISVFEFQDDQANEINTTLSIPYNPIELE